MTTKDNIKEKTVELLKDSIPELEKKIDKVLNSGCIDFDSWDDDYALPKIIVSLLGEELESMWMPLSTEYKEERENISRFI